jgi:3-phenylpropionate/trans-cinnamate dioxygenase ferredoxin reductase subunit
MGGARRSRDAGLLNLRLPRRQVAVVESVNRALDRAAAKRIIGTTKTLTPEEAADPAFDLRGLAKR